MSMLRKCSSYRCCIHRECRNTSVKTPEKFWIKVPNDVGIRNTWLKLVKRDPDSFSTASKLYLCEDHFDSDIINSVKRIQLKPNCVPPSFDGRMDRKRKLTQELSSPPFPEGVVKNNDIATEQLEDVYCDCDTDDEEDSDVNDENTVTTASTKKPTAIDNVITDLYEARCVDQSENENPQGIVDKSTLEYKIDSIIGSNIEIGGTPLLQTKPKSSPMLKKEPMAKRNDTKGFGADTAETGLTRDQAELKLVKRKLRLVKNRHYMLQRSNKILREKTKKFVKKMKALEKLKLPARIFTEMQLEHVFTLPKGRRFSIDEKILALSFYRASPKCYKLLQKNFIMPSNDTLKRINAASSNTAAEDIGHQMSEEAQQETEDRLHESPIKSQLLLYDRDFYSEEYRILEAYRRKKNTSAISSTNVTVQQMPQAEVDEIPNTCNGDLSQTKLYYFNTF